MSDHPVILLPIDDVGRDFLWPAEHGIFKPVGVRASTPNLDRLKREGVFFPNCWTQKFCAPTRATFMTGRYGFRTGLLAGYFPGSPTLTPLDLSEVTLPEPIKAAGIPTAHVGKWHLGNDALQGVSRGADHHFATSWNIHPVQKSYTNWDCYLNGTESNYTEHATVRVTDEALSWMPVGSKFFITVAYHAAHDPYHYPPGYSGDGSDRSKFVSMLEHLDVQIGRLLESLWGKATIIAFSDNGSPKNGVTPIALPPFQDHRAKGSITEGGIRNPIVVHGPEVVDGGRRCGDLIQTTDLFATVCEFLGIANATGTDSISFAPVVRGDDTATKRRYLFSDYSQVNGDPRAANWEVAIRDTMFKLSYSQLDKPRLYNLSDDPFERRDLYTNQGFSTERGRLNAILTDELGLTFP